MKTLDKISITVLLLSFCLLFANNVDAQNSFFSISGVIKDRVTKKPVEYVTISVLDHYIGTVSNADGEFILKIPYNINANFIVFSHIGYTSLRFQVQSEDISGAEMLLTPYTAILSDITVHGGDASYIVKEAIKNVPKNYCSSSSQLIGFSHILIPLYLGNL